MNKVRCIIALIIALAVSSCAGSTTPAPIPTISLDVASPAPSAAGSITASAVIVPVTKVELSFPVGGVVRTVEVNAGDSVSANQALVTLDAAILEARVAEAEANVVTQSTTLRYLKRTMEVGASPERIDAAQAAIDSAVAAVDIAKAELAQATLTAPFDGTIASVNISPAEFANPGEAIVTMGDLSHFRIETTDLSEKDVPSVKIGEAVKISIEALNQEAGGRVTDIARVSSTVGGDVVYKVTIEFDKQPDGLRWGMSADVKIIVE